eukprot:Rhum_TRINITY_DN20684_c0_g1::Rhum_TRINITY_DN20684_c0_g1_i1::g.171788::m.171788/K14399/CLP1, HERB; polyribonucleotide 5'-hydroxyl-kinase
MSTEVKLEAGCELRYEVLQNADRPGKVKLITEDSRFAEIAGAEMAPGTLYDLPAGTSGSIFTWHGCQLSLQNIPDDQVYTAAAPAMQHYAHAHSILEVKRREAKQRLDAKELADGPRAVVCGGPSSGKLSACRVLVNYAARLDWQLTFADLDISNNSIAVPGSVAAVPIDMPVPTLEGFSVFPPVSFCYGDTTMDARGDEMYHQVVSALADTVEARHAANSSARCGGLIVKAMSSRQTCKDVLHAARAFKLDTVFVVGDDKLHAQLQAGLEREGIAANLVQLPRSGGCITKSVGQRERERERAIDCYFNGWHHMKLHPHRYEVRDADKISLLKVGGSLKMKMDGLLPIGERSALTATDVTTVTPSKELEHCLVAFSQAKSIDELAAAPVLGYGKVLSVSADGKSLQLLIPMPVKELESDAVIVTDIRVFDRT